MSNSVETRARNMRKPPVRAKHKNRNWKVPLCLLLCFPYGLFLMWRETRWSTVLRCGITACVVLLTGFILLPYTNPPSQSGGVQLVGAEKNVEVFGPELPVALDANYINYDVSTNLSPALSDVEIQTESYVYTNDTGKYYHKLNCSYVAWYSSKLTAAVAHYSGYLPCRDCGVEAYQPG